MSPDTSLILSICPVQSEQLFSSGDLMMQGLPLTTGVNGKVILRFLDGVSILSLQNKHRGDPMSIFPKGFYVMAGLPELLGLLRGDTAVMSGLLRPTYQLLPLIIVLSPLHSGDGIFPPHTTQKSTQQKRRDTRYQDVSENSPRHNKSMPSLLGQECPTIGHPGIC